MIEKSRKEKPRAKPLHLSLRNVETVRFRCLRCCVGGTFTGTAAFLIECECGGLVRVSVPREPEEEARG